MSRYISVSYCRGQLLTLAAVHFLSEQHKIIHEYDVQLWLIRYSLMSAGFLLRLAVGPKWQCVLGDRFSHL